MTQRNSQHDLSSDQRGWKRERQAGWLTDGDSVTEREWQVPSPSFLITFIGYPHPSAAEGLDLPSLPTFSTTEEPHALISTERESRERKMKSEWGRKTINSAAVQLYSYWLMGVMLLILFMEEQLLCSLPEPQPIISNNWWLGRHDFPPTRPQSSGN